MNKHTSTVTLLGLAFAIGTASATTLAVNPTDDAMIFDNGSGSGSSNASGKGPAFFTGADSTPMKKRSLVKFDIHTIPTTATVTGVRLDLYVGQIAGSMGMGMGCGMSCTPASRDFMFYEVDYTNAWSEGQTGATACPNTAMPPVNFQQTCKVVGGTGQGWPYTAALGCLGVGSGASCGNDVTWQYYNANGTHLWPGSTHGAGTPQDQAYGSASFGPSTFGNNLPWETFTKNNFLNNQVISFTSTGGLISMVQDWVTTPAHNNGMEIRAANLETTTQSFIGWWSKDGAAANSNNGISPLLTVTY